MAVEPLGRRHWIFDLDGTLTVAAHDFAAIRRTLGIPPGRDVGRAWSFLKELRLDRGPLDPDDAREALLAWWAQQQAAD